MKSRISSKGQVTVPAAVRDRLGLHAGTAVEFLVREGASSSIAELLEETRGPGPKPVIDPSGGRS